MGSRASGEEFHSEFWMEKGCLLHGGQEAEREKEGQGFLLKDMPQ
jgi:hypothetical protein